jgi:hypothetical protein
MDANPPPVPVASKSDYKPILLTLLFSFVLGGGSCAGFLSTLNVNSSSPLSMFFAFAFGFCVLTFVGSLIRLVVKAIRDATKGPGGAP